LKNKHFIQHPSAKPEPGKAKEELWKTQNISPCKNITFNKIHQKKPK